jgi:phosphatidylglycerophosphatase GEP4
MPASSKFTLKQFLNVPGLKALGLIFTDPVMIIPSIHVPTLHALDLDRLKAQGIECLVFDKDNTLSYCYAEEVHPSVVPVLEKAHRLFAPGSIAILSNSAGSCDDVNFAMAKKTEESMDIPVIRHEAKKPGCLDEVVEHFEKKMQKKIQPQQICVIGKF